MFRDALPLLGNIEGVPIARPVVAVLIHPVATVPEEVRVVDQSLCH